LDCFWTDFILFFWQKQRGFSSKTQNTHKPAEIFPDTKEKGVEG
jgi:hypothetical protein